MLNAVVSVRLPRSRTLASSSPEVKKAERYFRREFMTELKRPAERRRTTRIPVDFPAKLVLGRKQYRCKAREFSEFGILLACDDKDLVGSDVDVDLTLESGQSSVSLKGIVAYATESGVGVRFKNISSEHRALLKRYIQLHTKTTKENPVGG